MSGGELLIRLGASPDHLQHLWCCGMKSPVSSHIRTFGDQKWQRFALLYNVEGEKYTIGQRFEDRETQGEYLFCYCDRVSKSSHCQITCEGGDFFVQNLQGRQGQGTFINGEQVIGKVQLKFGDILSLGVKGLADPAQVDLSKKGKKKEDKTAVFWFQEPLQLESMYTSSNSNGDIHKDGCFSGTLVNMVMENNFRVQKAKKEQKKGQKSSDTKKKPKRGDGNEQRGQICDFTPGRNTLVLYEILKHLPLDDIKTCRLVCSTWNDEATKLLMKRSVAPLDLSQGYISVASRVKLFSYVHEMKDVVSQGRFCLELPSCSDFGPEGKGGKGGPGDKLLSDMTWFFKGGFPHPVTTLDLSGSVRCKKEWDMWSSILENVGLHLEELSIKLELDLTTQESPSSKPFQVNFPVLKQLALKPAAVDKIFTQQGFEFIEVDNGLKMKDWVVSFVNASPKLQSLTLDSSDLYSAFTTLVLEQVIQGGFPHLNSLKLSDYPDSTLKVLLKLPRRLEKLTLNCNGYEEETVKDLSLLEEVIKKFSPSLEYFKITLPEVDEEREELWKNKGVKIPEVFPRLRIFKVTGAPGEVSVNLIFSDVSGLNYEKQFPNLAYLSVDPFEDPSSTGNVGSKAFFEMFFPAETEQICKSVGALDIPYLKESGGLCEYVGRIATMFPNAKNKYLDNARIKEAQSSGKGRKRKVSAVPSTRTLRPRKRVAVPRENDDFRAFPCNVV